MIYSKRASPIHFHLIFAFLLSIQLLVLKGQCLSDDVNQDGIHLKVYQKLLILKIFIHMRKDKDVIITRRQCGQAKAFSSMLRRGMAGN